MSDSEEENNRGKTSFDDKKKSKACRHFAYGLIEKAVENGWEDHETANLIILVAAQMDFNSARLIKCLEKTSTGTPEIMAVLIDNGHEFSARQLISMFLNKAQNIHKYFSLIGAALECQLFDFNDQETLEALIGMVQQQDYNMSDSERYARLLCEHCKSKRKVAKILSLFTTKSHFSLEESASFIHDIVTYDFFFDIPGDIESFYKNLRPASLKERLLILLSASKHLNSKNEIVESDADSEGNLMDFVVGEDDVSMASGSDLGSNESAEEDLLSESDEDEDKSSGKKNKKSKKNQKQSKESKKSKSSSSSSKGSSKSTSTSTTSSSGKRKGRIESSDDEGDGEVSSGDEADTLRSKASGGNKASESGNSNGGGSKDGGSVVSAKKRKLIIEDDDDDDEEQEQDSGAAEAKTAVPKTAVSKTTVSKSAAAKDTAKTTVVAVAKSVSVTSNATSNKKSKMAVQSSSSSSGSEASDSSGSDSSSGSSLSSGAKRNQKYIVSGAGGSGSGGVGGKQKNNTAKKNNLSAADTVKLYPSDHSSINGSSSSSGSDESDSESGSEGELRHFDDEAIEGEESSDGDSDGEGRRVSKNGSKSSGSGSSRSSRHMNMNIDDSESEDDSDDDEDRVEDEY